MSVTKRVHVLGIPNDESSSFMKGPALAPNRIRQVLHWGSANLTTERGIDLEASDEWQHVGDLTLGVGEDARTQIEAGIRHHLSLADSRLVRN